LHEVQFTKAYGVSRHTLREAISILVGEGLLSRTSFKGVEVTRLTAEDVRDIFTARRSIELSAVEAFAGASKAAADKLFRAIDAVSKASAMANSEAMNAADLAVHVALVAVHGSKRLSAAHAGLLRELHILLFNAYSDDELAQTAEKHREFGLFLRRGDLKGARAQLEERLLRAEAVSIAPDGDV
jgi:DNA-binding GntR family transcriptional regulator